MVLSPSNLLSARRLSYSAKTSWLFQPQSGYPGWIQAKERQRVYFAWRLINPEGSCPVHLTTTILADNPQCEGVITNVVQSCSKELPSPHEGFQCVVVVGGTGQAASRVCLMQL